MMKRRKKDKKSNRQEEEEGALSSRLPDLDYKDIQISEASMLSRASPSVRMGGSMRGTGGDIAKRFKNIDSGILPYEAGAAGISMSKAIELCQKAYANVSIVRNTIDGMVEFSSANLHFKSSNARARTFIQKWWSKINGNELQEQWFREYYRSGNVFSYRYDGHLSEESFKFMESIFGAVDNSLPVRYTILNPAHIYAESGVVEGGGFLKMLTPFELARLKNPQTEIEVEVFNSLSADVKKAIKSSTPNTRIFIPIDSDRITVAFYNKQPYEAMAIPMVYPVLDDIEWKMSLKEMDKKISSTVDNIILLITMGAKPEDGGTNRNNIEALQSLFQSPAFGRVLVSDYTTEAKFVIPDLQRILGKEKYEVVNADIKDGLQNILVGSEKFANQFIKTKVFLERLKQGQKVFLNSFLIPEIKRVCDAMGFKNYPIPEFEVIELEDKNTSNRVIVRLVELGILPPDVAFKVMQTGIYPTDAELISSQKRFIKDREEGLYYPLVGGSNYRGEAGRPQEKSGLEGAASSFITIPEIKAGYDASNKLIVEAEEALQRHLGGEQLSQEQRDVAFNIAKAVIENEEVDKWSEALKNSIESSIPPIHSETTRLIDEIAEEYEVEPYLGALIYHGKKIHSSFEDV